MNKTFLCLAFLISSFLISNYSMAQNAPCASPVPENRWEQELGRLIKELNIGVGNEKSQSQLYTIPVIVHVIHGGQSLGNYPNLAQGQINSQIRVLNEDFGGVGYNSANYPSTAFTAYADSQNITAGSLDVLGRIQIANCQVQFCMATKDSLGNILPEPGIERINYVNKGWSNPASFPSINAFTAYMNGTIKPASIWNVTKYFNIWISDVSGSTGLLGYATFPPFANLTGLNLGSNGTAQTDGIWCYSRAFGSVGIFPSGTYSGSNNRGRTSSHEVGHWLGLRHIWGDGNCLTDYCDDTPFASSSNFGNPTYPFKTTNCPGNIPNGEMFMNIMDYTNDAIKYMFTTDQSIRVQTTMLNSPYRNQLGTHNLCSVSSVPAVAQFNMPATTCENAVVTLSNASYGTPVPSFTWSATGGTSISPNPNSAIATLSFAGSGTFVVTLSASNGTLSSISKTIVVNPSPTVVISGLFPTVCLDDQVMLIAGGANSYVWQPGSITGNTFNYFAVTEQTISCTGTGDANCKSTQTFTIAVSECVGLTDVNEKDFTISLSPNPVQDNLSIALRGHGQKLIVVEVMDLTGKVLLSEELKLDGQDRSQQLSFKQVEAGVYFLRFTSQKGSTKTLKVVKE